MYYNSLTCKSNIKGGNTVRVWDSLAGGKLLTELTNHHKTVMSLTFAQDYTQFLTAGLDR